MAEPLKLNTANGSMSLVPEDGAGNVQVNIPRAGVITSDVSAAAGSDRINNAISLTQVEYDAIGTPDANTLYIIVG